MVSLWVATLNPLLSYRSVVKDTSVIVIEIFDRHEFDGRDRGIIGIVNVRVGDVLALEFDGQGKPPSVGHYSLNIIFARKADIGSENN